MGKTFFALNSPTPLAIDLERGCEAFFNRFEFDLLEFPTIEQIEQVIKELQRKCEYETLVIDTLTGLEKLYIDKFTQRDRTSLAEWGIIKPKLSDLYRDIISLPINLICTAQIQNVWDTEKFKLIGKRPHILKGLSGYYFDVIGRLERKNGKSPTIIINKSRFALPKKIENISFTKLRDIICEEWSENSNGASNNGNEYEKINGGDESRATPAQIKKLHALLGKKFKGDKEKIEKWKKEKKDEVAKDMGRPINHCTEISIAIMSAWLNELLKEIEEEEVIIE